ncbi:regulator of nitrogen metabolite repression [Aspergillus tubingensis]|uniref:regulator of nitrogen metabolite repression n=1 Tax=Aspergillus tubingensis TaxID=5068 RepID=UPI001577A321|nr:regulator of nitrogen metabolite repression [Aspergillus tubingensis]GFN11579.1 regulator of nitrogen metabolite repression [Aspergillus tubingensis]
MVDRSRPAASASVEDIGTMRSLTGGGWPVVLVPPTSGEEGSPVSYAVSEIPERKGARPKMDHACKRTVQA